MAKIRVLIADDHAMFRDAIRMFLANEEDIQVVGTAERAEEAVALAVETGPDVVLMDLKLPVCGGIEATRQILQRRSATRVIAVTMYRDDESISGMIQAGGQGYVLKESGAADLVRAIRIVAAGGVAMDPTVTVRMLAGYRRLAGRDARTARDELTSRELEVLRLIAGGANNAEVAKRLCLSTQTVKNVLSSIYQKLGVNNRTEAVVMALEQGMIQREQ